MNVLELLVLSVIVITLYLGPLIVRRSPPGRRAYGWMLIANLVVAALAYISLRTDQREYGDLLGVIAVGGAICLVVVPPMLRGFARRALMADRLRLAAFLIDVRDLLQPGMGAEQERELVSAILAVRSGKVEDAVEVLREARAQTSNPMARRQLDERVVMTYLYARMWERAIDHYESTLGTEPGLVSPQLLVEMVRAYCESGDIDNAAHMVETLEASPVASEPILAFLIHRARMVFLAFVGRTGAVEAIVARTGPLGVLPEAARYFWSGVARKNAGDKKGAQLSLEQAARLSGGDHRARDLAQKTLHSLDEPGSLGPHSMSPMAAQLADRLTVLTANLPPVAQAKPAPRLVGVRWSDVPMTTGLVALTVAVAVFVRVYFHGWADLGGLVRAGANVKSAVVAGEWWRLPTSVFLHVGLLHLVLNMLGLWILGKLLEQMYGSLRFLAIYMVSGLVGALTSVYLGPPGMSAGASGAVLGILGATVAELGLHRDHYPHHWSRALLKNLVFLAIAQVVIGFIYPMIDQAAHVGGLLTGAAVAVLLSPRHKNAATGLRKALAVILAVGAFASVGYGVVGVVANDFGDTLRMYEVRSHSVNGLDVEVPALWERVTDADDNTRFVSASPHSQLYLGRQRDVSIDEGLALLESNFDRESVRRATRLVFAVPDPWQGRELLIKTEDIIGDQLYRVVVFARRTGNELWAGSFRIPEALAEDAAPTLHHILESVTTSRRR